MKNAWPHVAFREFLTPNRRPYTLGPTEDADLVGMRLYGGGPFHRELKPAINIQKKSHFVIRSGDIIYNKLFAWKGTFGIVPPELDGMFVSDKFPTYELDENQVDRRYLRWYFRHPPLWEQARQMSTGSAALSKLTLNPPRFLYLTVPLPPLPEQRRIVAKIEQLAAKIDEANGLRCLSTARVETLMDAGRASIFRATAEKHRTKQLGSLVKMTSGENLTARQMDASLPYPVYGGGGVAGRYDRYLYEEPRIVIGRVGARCGCVFVTEPKAWVTDNALVLTSFSDCLNMGYLVHALTHLDLRQQANQAAQPVVSQKKINPQEIALPPLDEQRRIVDYLDAVQAKVDQLKALQAQTAAELDTLLPSILDKAFKGEL